MHLPGQALGAQLFRCRRRPLLGYLSAIRDYGVALLMPFIVGGVLALPIVFVLQRVAHINFAWRDNPSGTLLMFGLLLIGWVIGAWWFWLRPIVDHLVIYEHGFAWRVSLSKWQYFPDTGAMLFETLVSIQYRDDWTEKRDGLDRANATVAEKLAWLVLNLALSKRDVVLQTTDGREVLVENLLARFRQQDVERFLEHVSARVQSRSE